jgi:hypothetical protein
MGDCKLATLIPVIFELFIGSNDKQSIQDFDVEQLYDNGGNVKVGFHETP